MQSFTKFSKNNMNKEVKTLEVVKLPMLAEWLEKNLLAVDFNKLVKYGHAYFGVSPKTWYNYRMGLTPMPLAVRQQLIYWLNSHNVQSPEFLKVS